MGRLFRFSKVGNKFKGEPFLIQLLCCPRQTPVRLSPPPEPETEISDEINHHHGQQLNKVLNHLLQPSERVSSPGRLPDILTDLWSLSLEPPQLGWFSVLVEDTANRPLGLVKVWRGESVSPTDAPLSNVALEDLSCDISKYSLDER